MKGAEVKQKYPSFYKKHNMKDSDILFLVGEKIKIFRSY